MPSGIPRFLALTLVLASLSIPGLPSDASGQVLAAGGQVSMNRDLTAENTWGIGARAQLRLPLPGIILQGTADFFTPDCGTLECDASEVSLNLVWSLPVPFLARPYLGAGVAMQDREGTWASDEDSDYGINVLAGIILQGPAFRRFQPFIEGKYQVMQEFDNQMIFSGGILLRIF